MRGLIVALLLVPLGFLVKSWLTFPSDHTPEGAYLRVVRAVNETQPATFFAYTEEAAQHACYSMRDYRKQSLELVQSHFPEQRRRELEEKYGPIARSKDGADVFALLAEDFGWLDQLRRDMSGILRVDISGPRATVQTVKGTRYAFRRRPNGIWGMTAFTPTLVEEAERAARDFKQLQKAALDYRRAEQSGHK
jgi:hypothetical protein